MNWSVNTQAPAASAGAALGAAFSEEYPTPEDGAQKQFDDAVTAVEAFLADTGDTGWFQFNISGLNVSADATDGSRPFISIGVSPVATPYGV